MKLWTLTVGLFHPAVVGSAFVLLLTRTAKLIAGPNPVHAVLTDSSLHFGAILLVLLSGSFLRTSDSKDSYGWGPFCLDMLECGLVFAAYYAAGLLGEPGLPSNMRWAFGWTAVFIGEAWIWSRFTKPNSASRSAGVNWFRFVTALILAAIAWFSPLPDGAVHVVNALFLLSVLWYLSTFDTPEHVRA